MNTTKTTKKVKTPIADALEAEFECKEDAFASMEEFRALERRLTNQLNAANEDAVALAMQVLQSKLYDYDDAKELTNKILTAHKSRIFLTP